MFIHPSMSWCNASLDMVPFVSPSAPISLVSNQNNAFTICVSSNSLKYCTWLNSDFSAGVLMKAAVTAAYTDFASTYSAKGMYPPSIRLLFLARFPWRGPMTTHQRG